MSSLKFYVADFNGMLTELKQRLADKLTTPREADVWIVWQDIRGSFGDLITTSKKYYPKPVYVVQHGRGAAFDYGPPHGFPLNADKFLCWGKSDYDKMAALGYGDKTVIVGCPLNGNIKPKVEHKEKVVLFIPVNTGKEEPENIAVYYELLKIKYDKAKTVVLDYKEPLKDKWGFDGKISVNFNELAKKFDVAAKLLPWHDKNLYHGNTVVGYQDSPDNNKLLFELLRNVDLVVGLDEGTTEIFAYGHNVPVIIVDGFKYRQYGVDGRKYSIVDGYKTKAARHVELKDLAKTIDEELSNPSNLEKERQEIAEVELGLSAGNAVDNIIKVIKNDFKA